MSEFGTPRSIQENQEDYRQQWRLLEELKASITFMDMDERPDEDKTDEENWFVIGQVPLESDAVSISESEGYLGLPSTYPKSNRKEEDRAATSEKGKPEQVLYQDQWQDLEELKVSLNTMGWPAESSDLSVSGQASSVNRSENPNESKLSPDDFVEPIRRRTPTSLPSRTAESADSGQASGHEGSLLNNLHLLSDAESPSSAGLTDVQHTSMVPGHDQSPSAMTHADQDQAFEHRWFPSRPSAVGNDGLTDQFPSPLLPAQLPPGMYSDDTPTESPPPPQRLQPDGSELRQRLAVKPSFVTPPGQLDKDKVSAPTGKGGSIQSVQRQSATAHVESPVSQLLGPNFKAAQQVLDLLKQDRLLGRRGDDGTPSLPLPQTSSASRSGSLSELGSARESGASSIGPPGVVFQHVGRPRPEKPYSHSTPSSDDMAYSQTGVGAEILRQMEQRYGTSPTDQTGQSSGQKSDASRGGGDRYMYAAFEMSRDKISDLDDSGRERGASRRRSRPLEDRGAEHVHVGAAEDSGLRNSSSETSGHRHGVSDDTERRLSTSRDSRNRHVAYEGQRRAYWSPPVGGVLSAERNVQTYGSTSRENRAQTYEELSPGDSGLKFDESRRSSVNASLVAGSEETPPSGAENTRRTPDRFHSSAAAHASDASSNDTDDLLNYDAAIESGLQFLAEKRERNLTAHPQPAGNRGSVDDVRYGTVSGSSGVPSDSSQLQQVLHPGREDDLTQYHMSLGAGLVTPLQDDVTPAQSYSSVQTTTPPSVEKNSSSSQESLQVQDIEDAEAEDSPSSTDLYQPVLAGAGASRAASYGIYDIRRSSGPGSTNRRRRAMGLDPLSHRKEGNTRSNDTVYVSGGSTPVAPDERTVMSVDSAHSASSTDLGQFEQMQATRASSEGAERGVQRFGVRPAHQHARAKATGSAQQSEDALPMSSSAYLEKRRADSAATEEILASGASGSQASLPRASAGDRTRANSRRTTDSGQRRAEWVPGFTPSTGKSVGDSAASSGGTSTQGSHECFPASKLPYRREQAPNKALHGYESESLTSGADSVASNISKLSQMILRPLSARASLSSQTSVATPVEREWPLRGRLTGSSSSEPSSTAASVSSGFVDPNLSPSVEQQLRLRELLKSLGSRQVVGSRLIPPSVGESSTDTGSVSGPGSTSRGDKHKKTPSFKEKIPSPKREKYKRTTKRSYVKDRRGTAGQCICGLQEKPRSEAQGGRGRSRDVHTAARPTRDVAVCVTPGITHKEDNKRTEDACTQTDAAPELAEKAVQSSRPERRFHETQADRRPVLVTPLHAKSPSRKQTTKVSDPVQSGTPEGDETPTASENVPPPAPTAAKNARKQGPAWFCSVSNEHFSQASSARLDHFQVELGARVQVPEALQKLTLQEAFMTAKPDFVQRSRDRLMHVKDAAKSQRKPFQDAAYKENATAGNASPTNAAEPASPTSKLRRNCDQLHKPKPRKMLRHEMYEMNHRLYKNLPEVKARQEENRRQAFYRTNRLRAQLFNKRVQNRLKLQRS